MFETEALQISANFKQSIWYTNLLWDEFRYPANDTCDVHYVQISIKYYFWSLLCFSGKETKRISEFRTHSTQLLSGLHFHTGFTTHHLRLQEPCCILSISLETTPTTFTCCHHNWAQERLLAADLAVWGVTQRSPELPYVELLLKSQLGKQALSETSAPHCTSVSHLIQQDALAQPINRLFSSKWPGNAMLGWSQTEIMNDFKGFLNKPVKLASLPSENKVPVLTAAI